MVEDFSQRVDDATCAFDLAASIPGADPGRIVAFGEGFGGALALAVAEARPVWKAVALNPYPTAELLTHAPQVSCPVLLGTSRMDDIASPSAQDELAALLPNLVHKNYPKYVHERINAFENEFLSFVHE